MIEKTYRFQQASDKLIEKLIDDENLAINHIVLAQGDYVPEHFSNSNVYLLIIRGTMTLQLQNQEKHYYQAGTIINLPYHIKMNISNEGEELLEFFVVKAPNPRYFSSR